MVQTLFPAPENVTVPIAGEDRAFPVRRIFCVGRNYEAHAREMGHEVDREAPFYFTKSVFSVQLSGQTQPYPPGTHDYHHEMELVVALSSGGAEISQEDALNHIYGYACGLDMTRRDLQQKGKDKRRPWDLGKDFDNSAVLAPIVPVRDCGHPTRGRISLTVDGDVRQEGDLQDLIWSVPEIIADLSKFYVLQAGDLIFTGTPSGVGPVERGQELVGSIAGLGEVRLTVGS